MNTLLLSVYVMVKSWMDSEEGQDLIEYGLIAGLIALACVAALTLMGGSLNTMWGAVQAKLNTAVP